jgi:nitrate/TMAO reductase-like tetraheme cytochrome c subunit
MTGRKTRVSLPLFFSAALLVWVSPRAAAQSDEDCLTCHEESDLKSEAGRSVFVNPAEFEGSIHGQAGVSCVDCHADLSKDTEFPHRSPLKEVACGLCHETALLQFRSSIHQAANEKGTSGIIVGCKDCHGTHGIKPADDFDSLTFPINLPGTCEKCHLEKVPSKKGAGFIGGYNQSAHFRALEKSGLTMSANCGNCHSAHDIKSVADPLSLVSRKNIIKTCGTCHLGIQKSYLGGVHGIDYVKGIKDVPVCTDCHNEHNIRSPEDIGSTVYSTRVAQVCSRCHDDIALSRQYGFLTSRLRTYNESFHGTAARFGETRVANCASCHGFHDIRASADPKSSINKENLPATCGKCHPGASRHFAEGHIHSAPEQIEMAKYRTSHVVKEVYIFIIAAIIAVMVVFISADFLRRVLRKQKHG